MQADPHHRKCTDKADAVLTTAPPQKNNLQDLWLSGLNFSKDDLKQVKELDNIKDAERALTLTTTLDK